MKKPQNYLKSISVYFNRVPPGVSAEIIESKFEEIQKEVNANEEPDLYKFIQYIRGLINDHVECTGNYQSVII